ncbi:MAG: TonB-dependent receptor, partial [Gammaproteobacteria bacterium]|nr:TonB-dependent receptor [Gammaproteobacteria bacterium]
YALADQFSTSTGAKTTLSTDSLKPERGMSFEGGHRYQGELVATSVSAFGMQFNNRQVTSTIVDPTNPSTTTSLNINAGKVSMYGIDAEVGTRPLWGGFRPYVSGELLKTKLEDNLQTTNSAKLLDYLPTKGKELPRAPGYTAGIGLDYDDNHIIANIAYKYIGPQYSTFMNDEKMKGFGVVNAAIGYRFSDVNIFKGTGLKTPEIKLNLYNIFDKRVLTGVSGVQTNALATQGLKGGTISASSSPSYYAGEGFAAMLTFQSGF